MGQWGLSPFDSDNFADMAASLSSSMRKPMAAALEKELAKGKRHIKNYPSDAWAAVGCVLWAYHTGLFTDEYNHLLDGALEIVETLKADTGFNSTWTRGDGSKREMNERLEIAEEMLMDMRGRHARPTLPNALVEKFPDDPLPRRARRRR